MGAASKKPSGKKNTPLCRLELEKTDIETGRVRLGTDMGTEQERAGWKMKIKSGRAGELMVSYPALSEWRVMHTWA